MSHETPQDDASLDGPGGPAAGASENSLADLVDLDWGAFDEDLPFYENLARRCDGPVLELGAGTGRVALALTRAGHEVWGVDAWEEMLARARCKAGRELEGRLHLLRADMRDFDLGRQFELAFAAFGTFHHLLTPDDQLACLRCVARHLAPGGLFACDLRPFWHDEWEAGDSVPLLHDWTRPLPETGESVTKLRAARTDRARQTKHETHIYDRLSTDGTLRRLVHEVDLRFVTRYEMEGLLRDAGLHCDRLYGDFDLSPFNEESPYLIAVAQKR
jgi:SAM-dependent methyltransferase